MTGLCGENASRPKLVLLIVDLRIALAGSLISHRVMSPLAISRALTNNEPSSVTHEECELVPELNEPSSVAAVTVLKPRTS